MKINKYKYYYFIGIGGIGMSALARYFKGAGKTVLGYDKTNTDLTKTLINEGINIHFTDTLSFLTPEMTPENTLVIYTPAVPKTLSELVYFMAHQFTVKKRAEVLGKITKDTFCLAVAGTHGKTTTSTLLSHILYEAKLPFSAFLGGIANNYSSNFIYNGTEISVVEADEYDRSFLKLHPNMACITSVDADHLDIYGEKESFLISFRDFGNLVADKKKLFIRNKIADGKPFDEANSYAVDEKCDFSAKNIRVIDGDFWFDVITPNTEINDFKLTLAGRHNVENATVAIAMSLAMGIDSEVIKTAVANFTGIQRRFAKFISSKNKIYIDDYAHHPTELKAAFSAVKELYPNKKVLAVFQPHLFSRTRDFVDDFAESLSMVDQLILLDIYPAREEPILGVTSDWLLDKVTIKDKTVCTLENALEVIQTKDFEVIITVGAGNIDTLVQPIKNWLA